MPSVRINNEPRFKEDFRLNIANLSQSDADDYLEYMSNNAAENPESSLFLQCPRYATVDGISKIFDFLSAIDEGEITLTYVGVRDAT